MQIVATRVTRVNFFAFGRYVRLAEGEAEGLLCSRGDGWSDVCTQDPLIGAPAQLGLTVGSAMPCVTWTMERHPAAEEAFLCMTSPIVLPVALASQTEYPRARDVAAYVLEPGDVVVLKPGVWHDACHGVNEPAPYFWLAAGSSSASPEPWASITDGPVEIRC